MDASDADTQFLQYGIHAVNNPLALIRTGISHAVTAHPVPGADQQFAGDAVFRKFQRKIQGMAVCMFRLHGSKQFRMDGNPVQIVHTGLTKIFIQIRFDFLKILISEFVYHILFHNL